MSLLLSSLAIYAQCGGSGSNPCDDQVEGQRAAAEEDTADCRCFSECDDSGRGASYVGGVGGVETPNKSGGTLKAPPR